MASGLAGTGLPATNLLAAGDPSVTVVAFPSLNPLDWLGGAAAGAAADAWKNAMVGLWSAGLWVLQHAFKVIDAFTVPDVSAGGPLAGALPTTLWLGLTVAALVMTTQLVVALVRRDGQSLGRILIGIGQFGVVWVCYLAVASLLIVAAGALTRGILSSMLHVGSWAQYSVGDSWPRSIDDAVAASVLGLCSLFMLIPASFGYLMVMLVREAALVVLLATAPISAGGLLNDTTKTWFWKTLRWFIASLLIAPAAALILGIGVQLSNGVVQGAGTDTVAACGAAVVGCVLVLIGAVCPMTLFKLLAFVEPGTASGAAFRQSMSDAGGVSGLLSGGGGKGAGGSTSAATSGDGGGRSQGEAAAETATTSRMASMLGPVGAGIGMGMKVATKAADLASDVLGSGGVGDPGYSAGWADNAARTSSSGGGQGGGGGQGSPGGSDAGSAGSTPSDGGAPSSGAPAGPAPAGPTPAGLPMPPAGPAGGSPGGPGKGGPGASGGGGAGAVGGGAGLEAAAVVV